MHRSQILLEEGQYQYLGDEARRKGIMMSQIVRELITERIESRRGEVLQDDPFFDIIAMLSSGDGRIAEEAFATDHHFRQMDITVVP
jgi:hypothetical protein